VLKIVFITLLIALPASTQVRKLHSRDLTRLSQVQVGAYLERSDIIFVPVGAVETNGILPSGRDYVWPLAYAMTMADETDALYAPGLQWSYPGTTVIAPATMYMSPHEGAAHLKTLAKTLLRQGFRRQVYLSMSHGPAALTVGTMIREFFDETHVPLLYIDMDHYLPRLKLAPATISKTLFGAHYIAGRLDDLPLKGEYGESHAEIPVNEGLATLGKLGFSGSLALGSWVPDAMAHGVSALTLPATAEEREAWGKEGKAQIAAVVKQMRMPEALDALRKHDRFTQDVIVKKLEKYLPK
jgi:creatinine amidohydrolase